MDYANFLSRNFLRNLVQKSQIVKKVKTTRDQFENFVVDRAINIIKARNEPTPYQILFNGLLSEISKAGFDLENFDDKETKWEDLCIKNLSELLVNTGSQSISESMTEITNEEYIKTINEAINLMIIGLTKEKKTIRQIFAPFIKSKVSKEKDKETSTDMITIDEFNEELKKIEL